MRTILCLLVVVCAVKATMMGDFMDWEQGVEDQLRAAGYDVDKLKEVAMQWAEYAVKQEQNLEQFVENGCENGFKFEDPTLQMDADLFVEYGGCEMAYALRKAAGEAMGKAMNAMGMDGDGSGQ